MSYLNIKKLDIIVESLVDFHRLLTILPNIEIANVILQNDSTGFNDKKEYSLVENLVELKLRSLSYSFNLNELLSILN